MKKLLLSALLLLAPLSASAGLFISRDCPMILEPRQTCSISAVYYYYPGENREDPKKAAFWSDQNVDDIFEVTCRDGSIPRVYDPRIDIKKPAPPAGTPYRVTCP